VIGSISLSPPALNSRREVAAVIRNPANAEELARFFESHGTTGSVPNEWSVPDQLTDDDDAEDND
jgi:hypothetical protein